MSRTKIFRYERTTWLRQFYQIVGKTFVPGSGTMPAALSGPMEIVDNEQDDILDVGEQELEIQLDPMLTDTYSSLTDLVMRGNSLAFENSAFQKELDLFDVDPEPLELEKENCLLENCQLKGTLEEHRNLMKNQEQLISNIQKEIGVERQHNMELQQLLFECQKFENKSASKEKKD